MKRVSDDMIIMRVLINTKEAKTYLFKIDDSVGESLEFDNSEKSFVCSFNTLCMLVDTLTSSELKSKECISAIEYLGLTPDDEVIGVYLTRQDLLDRI